MAKVNINSEKITLFGGKFHERELFSRYVCLVVDKVLEGDALHMVTNTVRLSVRCRTSTSMEATAWKTKQAT